MSDNKSELKFFLKIMAAYFGLYLIHFVIYPNTPLYNNSYIERLIWVLSVLLLPFFDIFILKSNIFYGSFGIALYDLCVYIYCAEGAYSVGYFGLFGNASFSQEVLLYYIAFWTVYYILVYIAIYIIIFIIEIIKNKIKNNEDKKEKP